MPGISLTAVVRHLTSNLRTKGGIFGSQFESLVRHGGEGLAPRMASTVVTLLPYQEAQRDGCLCSAHFLLLFQSWTPAYGMMSSCSAWVFPLPLSFSVTVQTHFGGSACQEDKARLL